MAKNTAVTSFCGGTLTVATITPGSGNLTTSAATAFGLLSWSLSGVSVGDIETTHITTSGDAKTYIPQCYAEGGTVDAECILDTDDDITALVGQAVSVCTITFPVGSAGTAGNWQFPSYINNWTATGTIDEKTVGTITLKVAGDITVTSSL